MKFLDELLYFIIGAAVLAFFAILDAEVAFVLFYYGIYAELTVPWKLVPLNLAYCAI